MELTSVAEFLLCAMSMHILFSPNFVILTLIVETGTQEFPILSACLVLCRIHITESKGPAYKHD